MSGFALVTYRPERGRARTVRLNVTADTASMLVGSEVDESGETRWFDGGTTERVHVIEQSLIERRVPLTLDTTYVLLVEDGGRG